MSANAGEGEGQGMVEAQNVPEPDIGGTASALLGMAVDDEEEDWEDCSDSEQSDCDEENWKIGLVEAPVVPEALNPEFFPSKVGGDPAWLDPKNLPSDADLRCQAKVRGETCGQRLSFLLQVYAPISDGPPEAFHRSIFLFVCSNVLCCGKQGSVRAFRCQLPRENPYYSHEPPEYPDERPKVSEIVEEEEENDMSGGAADAVVEAGRKCKEEGNMLYKAADYKAAVSKYYEALEQMRATACAYKKNGEGREGGGGGDGVLEPWLKGTSASVRAEYARICSNVGECWLKQQHFARVVAECSKAIAADANNVKAWYRRAKGWTGIAQRQDAASFGAAQKARDDLTRALKVCDALKSTDTAASTLNTDLQKARDEALKLLKGAKELCKAQVRLVEQEIVITDEPYEHEVMETQEARDTKRLLAAYEQKEADAKAGGDAMPAETDPELQGLKEKVDPQYLAFKLRTERMKQQALMKGRREQCLRYSFAEEAKPLWLATAGRCGAGDVPACAVCGKPRCFEFQVMPQMLSYLLADAGDTAFLEAKSLVTREEAEFVEYDWGVLAVYSCPHSCTRTREESRVREPSVPSVVTAAACAYVEEFVWVQENNVNSKI